MTEYLRPWKLFSLAAGVVLLIAGWFYYHAPDWDIPISLIMATLVYLTAPWSMRVALRAPMGALASNALRNMVHG